MGTKQVAAHELWEGAGYLKQSGQVGVWQVQFTGGIKFKLAGTRILKVGGSSRDHTRESQFSSKGRRNYAT